MTTILYERLLLYQRGMIETVIGRLMHCFQVWHTRHRSIMNALTHLVAALAAYTSLYHWVPLKYLQTVLNKTDYRGHLSI